MDIEQRIQRLERRVFSKWKWLSLPLMLFPKRLFLFGGLILGYFSGWVNPITHEVINYENGIVTTREYFSQHKYVFQDGIKTYPNMQEVHNSYTELLENWSGSEKRPPKKRLIW